jgi:hypothetical protein
MIRTSKDASYKYINRGNPNKERGFKQVMGVDYAEPLKINFSLKKRDCLSFVRIVVISNFYNRYNSGNYSSKSSSRFNSNLSCVIFKAKSENKKRSSSSSSESRSSSSESQ